MCCNLCHKPITFYVPNVYDKFCDTNRLLQIMCHNLCLKPITWQVRKHFRHSLQHSWMVLFLLRNLVISAMFLVFCRILLKFVLQISTHLCVTNLCVTNSIFSCSIICVATNCFHLFWLPICKLHLKFSFCYL